MMQYTHILTLVIAGALLWGPGGLASQAQASPPDAAEVRRIFAPPPGSLSVGATGGGRLERAHEIPLKGPGWAFLPIVRPRGTNFGTEEMAGLLRRVAARVAADFPGARLGVGNVSLAEGGRSRWHASHQAGRDVDILMFSTDSRGRSVNPTRFFGFGADGKSRDGRFHFDAKRNLSLVEALVTDPEVGIQWIFVSDELKARLLAAAAERGRPTETIERLSQVLHQPTDALPHDDHFHVRLFCSPEDRRYGCLDFGPFWAWVDRGDAAFEARVADLVRVMAVKDNATRLKAIRTLADIRARSAVPALLASLEDTDDGIRDGSLRALRTIGDPAALPALLALLARTPDPAFAAKLFSAMLALPTQAVLDVARGYLSAPGRYLHPGLAATDPLEFRTATTRVLARYGRIEVVPELLALLAAPSADLRRAAHEALIRVTNIVPDAPSPTSSSLAARTQAAWQQLWNKHKAEPWSAWLRRGFDAAGYRLKPDLSDPASIEVLIEATGDSRPHIAQNAVRLLSDLTGHVVDPRSRPPARQRRHWQYWWSRHLSGDSTD
ncbi:MAG: penicillin-insensitive murein endopeptidase [Myxococcota bacterium]